MSSVLDEYGRSGLHYAASERNAMEASKHIAFGEDVNSQDYNRWTPLHLAARAYSLENVRLLIEAGAQIDPRDDYGNTPLSTAVFSCQDRNGAVIEFLRDAGANVYAENDHRVSPYSLAQSIGNYDVVQYFSDLTAGPNENTSQFRAARSLRTQDGQTAARFGRRLPKALGGSDCAS